MNSLQRILVPVDESAASQRALELGIGIARVHQGELFLCHAIDYGLASIEAVPVVIDAMTDAADALLRAGVERAAAAGIKVQTAVLNGSPERAIVTHAEETKADAIVIGTAGKIGWERLLLGSTTEAILRAASVPVFTVHAAPEGEAPAAGTAPFRRILVAVDDSDPADAAADFAIGFALAEQSEIVFCYVIDDEKHYQHASRAALSAHAVFEEWRAEGQAILEAAVKRAKEKGIKVARGEIARGEAASQILSMANGQAADLIAIGTHGRRGLRRMLLGSVAEEVVRQSALPVAVVRGPATKESRAAK